MPLGFILSTTQKLLNHTSFYCIPVSIIYVFCVIIRSCYCICFMSVHPLVYDWKENLLPNEIYFSGYEAFCWWPHLDSI